MQFYFLSIVTNLLAGVTLAGDYLAAHFPGLQLLLPGLNRRTARLTIGSITAAVGILKLLVYANSLQIVVVGDRPRRIPGSYRAPSCGRGRSRTRGGNGTAGSYHQRGIFPSSPG